jgi:hypothetical protein
MSLEHSWHEQQLLEDLAVPVAKGEVEIIYDLPPIVGRLASSFPVEMNRINWNAVTDKRILAAPQGRASVDFNLSKPDSAAALLDFWSQLRCENNINDDSDVLVLGDSLIAFVLRLSIATLTKHLISILSIPHHTYVFPEDVAWCLNYTAEDDVFFAKRPTRAPHAHAGVPRPE